ncbi:MAG: hypothetical protein ACRD1J_07135 [Terriglobia bacterium]
MIDLLSWRTEGNPLKNIILLFAALVLPSTLAPAKALPKRTNFSGNWVLDTGQTKNLPHGLESYSMSVSQDGQQLQVKTSLKGDLRPVAVFTEPYPGAGPGGWPSGSRGRLGGGMGRMGGMGMPGGGGMSRPMSEGIPEIPGSTGSGGTGRESRTPGRSAVFIYYPSNAAYKLDGDKTTTQFGGPMHADATLKANWAKSGTVLKLSLEGNQRSTLSNDDIQLTDQWKLSKDGQSLMVDRAFHSARGSTTLHLVFHKQSAAPTSSATQGHAN